MKLKTAVTLGLIAAVSAVVAAATPEVLYVYKTKSDPLNRYIPSGWMGDYGELKLDDANRDKPTHGNTSIRWTYDAKSRQGAGWTGVFWQHPANNWGNKPGGYDLSGYKRLTFWARGAKGGEVINEFKVGGITGEFSDTDAAAVGPVTLTAEWKKYTIDLSGKDLSKIIGGFCWAASRDSNPDGFVIYFDDIKFEK